MARRKYSLRNRLLLSATLVLFVFLGLMGVVLDHAFQRSAEQAVRERLLLHIYGLLAATEEANGRLYLPEALQEPDFNRLGTGLYGLVMDVRGDELWRSESAVDLSLPASARRMISRGLVPGDPAFGYVANAQGVELFYLSYRVVWKGAGNMGTPYTFTVLQTMDPYLSEIRGFRNNLWGWLVGVVVVLLAVQAGVMSWGLSPLKGLARDLKQIEDGEQDFLEGDYPPEIEGVTRNLNVLLSSEREQREKYRTTLADLAHSLKTPLAILKGSVASLAYVPEGASVDEVRRTVDEQVERMDEIVAYQLERAVTKSSNLIRKAISVEPIVTRLQQAMEKVYGPRGKTIELVSAEASFYGDERDLMELLGNLVDNACKYSASHVRIGISGDDARRLKLVIEDDGPGIAESDRTRVLNRGARLDSREPGQGIGLAVVMEIVKRYNGRIDINESELGGARVDVSLPA